MTIQIPADIEARICQEVERGNFPDAVEEVRAAMRFLDEQERQLEELRVKQRPGIKQLDRGEGVPFTPELMAQIRRDAKDRFRRGEFPSPDVVP